MARAPAIVLEDVANAVSAIIAKGGKPTIAKVREALGNTGSPNTISKFLKELKGGSADKPTDTANKAEKSAQVEPKPKPVQVDTKKPEQAPKPQKPKAKSEFEADTADFDSDKPVEIRVEFEPAPEETKSATPKPQDRDSRQKPQQNQNQERNQDRNRNQGGQNRNQDQNRGQGRNQQGQNQGQGRNQQNQNRSQQQGQNRNNQNQGQNQGKHPNQNQGQNPNQQKPVQRKERFAPRPRPAIEMETEVYQSENLEVLSQEQLVAKVRRLETILNKEQFRRESAEEMARNAKEYAETIKQQVSARINDVKEASDIVIESLQSQIKVAEHNAEKDLRFYREHLAKANKKIQGS